MNNFWTASVKLAMNLPGIFLEIILTWRIVAPHIISLEIPCAYLNRTSSDPESGAPFSMF